MAPTISPPIPLRPLLVALLLLLSLAPSSPASWSAGAERQAVNAGLMRSGGWEGTLGPAELQQALNGYAARQGVESVRVGGGRLTMARFHRALVRQLEMTDVAAAVQAETRRAGLRPPARFGTEVVARMLALRVNHPTGREALERYPWDAVPRREAAWSLARMLELDGSQQAYVRGYLGHYGLPRYSAGQLRPLRLAVSKVGMPYIWGGEGDGSRGADGRQARGGYDCSGFAWRVFKMSRNPAGRQIRGRTAAQQAGEIPRASRLRLEQVQPGDLVFFGRASFTSRATEAGITHQGIALSRDFMIHSSSAGAGVYVSPLFEPWRARAFTWARRVL